MHSTSYSSHCNVCIVLYLSCTPNRVVRAALMHDVLKCNIREYSVQYAHNSDLDCLASHNQHLWISLVLDVLSQYY